jgi:hypothetical protein
MRVVIEDFEPTDLEVTILFAYFVDPERGVSRFLTQGINLRGVIPSTWTEYMILSVMPNGEELPRQMYQAYNLLYRLGMLRIDSLSEKTWSYNSSIFEHNYVITELGAECLNTFRKRVREKYQVLFLTYRVNIGDPSI